ncbi:hypothetical protein [Bifidobacterium goeldii]|uniref:hypothetical protein n=1 Tax=Bifidobacterium goeldii TaxID=2306975 RepID=UPI001F497BDC|nr:hypothetical protein [Bifidobacterium goeldii]
MTDMPIGTSAGMSAGLELRRLETIERCTAVAKRLGRPLLFGMTTSLMLQSVPLPEHCNLDMNALHTVSSSKSRRIRIRDASLRSHVWTPMSLTIPVRINDYVFALDLFHTWAQLAVHVPLETLVVLGDSVVTAVAGNPSLAKGRDASGVYRDFVNFANPLPSRRGSAACAKASRLVLPGSGSPKESACCLMLRRYGLPCPERGYVIPRMTFRSGVPMTLDMAWPKALVAVEYDGDQHRTDKWQWRRDQEKRDRARARGWLIFVATSMTLDDDAASVEFAFSIARQLVLRGVPCDFQLVAMSLERLACSVRDRE